MAFIRSLFDGKRVRGQKTGTGPSGFVAPPRNFRGRGVQITIDISGDLDISPPEDRQLILEREPPEKAMARILVLECDESLKSQLSGAETWPWPNFVNAHLQNDKGLQRELERDDPDAFFFTEWSRLVTQSPEALGVDQRILANKPYDVDTIGDPWDLHLNHTRFCHWPDYPFRAYDPVSVSKVEGELYHSAKQPISFCKTHIGGIRTGMYADSLCAGFPFRRERADNNGAAFKGVVLVDPTRYHRVFNVSFNFWAGKSQVFEQSDTVPCLLPAPARAGSHQTIAATPATESAMPASPIPTITGDAVPADGTAALLDRFVASVRRLGRPGPVREQGSSGIEHYSVEIVKSAVAQLIYEDQVRVLSSMGRQLDAVELALHDNGALQASMSIWRGQLGLWRNTLFHQSTALRDLSKYLTAEGFQRPDEPDLRWRLCPLGARFSSLEADLGRMVSRIESTFHLLMSSMSILESERAINEAEVVSKLTHLAFFFIPLGLVAGVFGMNINVSTSPGVGCTETSAEGLPGWGRADPASRPVLGVPGQPLVVALVGGVGRR